MHKQLRDLRVMLRLTQFDVAKRSGVGRTRVSLFENGHIDLQPDEVAAIRRALKNAATERVRAIRSFSTVDQTVAV